MRDKLTKKEITDVSEEALVSYTTSRLMVEKGFPKIWGGYYHMEGGGLVADRNPVDTDTPAIRLALLQNWLMKNHAYYVYPVSFGKKHWSYSIDRLGASALLIVSCYNRQIYSDYTKAFEAGLVEALTLIKHMPRL